MSEENPLWGTPRIQAELTLLGFKVAESTVAKYRDKIAKPKPPSQTWKTFLSNHASEIVGIDFLYPFTGEPPPLSLDIHWGEKY